MIFNKTSGLSAAIPLGNISERTEPCYPQDEHRSSFASLSPKETRIIKGIFYLIYYKFRASSIIIAKILVTHLL